ncbi:MAG: STAS domain-containing protein [Actinobacteria bacterium]|nr:STAS domain-containing protein [Actinomycetota bacterium]
MGSDQRDAVRPVPTSTAPSGSLGLPDLPAASADVLAVAGDIDIATAPRLRERILEHVDATQGDLVLDVADVPFMDSSGFAVLLTAQQRLKPLGRRLALRNAQPPVISALRMSRLDSVIPLEGDPA